MLPPALVVTRDGDRAVHALKRKVRAVRRRRFHHGHLKLVHNHWVAVWNAHDLDSIMTRYEDLRGDN
jgi:hypothetical protein